MNRLRLAFSLLFIVVLQKPTLLVPALISLVDHPNQTSNILQDVLKEISEIQNWEIEKITRNSKLKVSKVRSGSYQRYEFRIRFGNISLLVKYPDEDISWNRLNVTTDLHRLVRDVASTAVLDTVKLQGPFDLWVGSRHHLSLSLPLNVSHSGFKRVLVGEGITVEVKQAQQLSLFQTFDSVFSMNASPRVNHRKAGFRSFFDRLSMSLPPVHVIGSASLIAYKTRNPNAPVETSLLSKGIIELLPEKCYRNNRYVYMPWPQLGHSLSLKVDRLGKLLRMFLGNKMGQNWFSGFVRSNVKAETGVQFQLELEMDVGSNVTLHGGSEDWRTRPAAERVWFDVVARVEDEKLRPVTVKKVKPFIAVDSVSWSNLMSNISFTKFPSILVPPEALTLDVKW